MWALASRLSRSLNVIGTDIDWSAAYDFLLTFRSNHGLSRTVSEKNIDFSWKSIIFPTPVYFAPQLKGFLLELGICACSQKVEWWGYQAEKAVSWYLQPSGYNTRMWQTDGQTDGETQGNCKDITYAQHCTITKGIFNNMTFNHTTHVPLRQVNAEIMETLVNDFNPHAVTWTCTHKNQNFIRSSQAIVTECPSWYEQRLTRGTNGNSISSVRWDSIKLATNSQLWYLMHRK